MTILEQMRTRLSAEDIFALLEVPYDQAVLQVSRLHILKRMGEYLRKESLAPDAPDEVVRQRCQAALTRAYADFVISTPIEQRVFKVHQDAVRTKPKRPAAFVPLSALVNGPVTTTPTPSVS